MEKIPFDWNLYLTGDYDCFTEDGREATQGHRFDIDIPYSIRFVLDSDIYAFNCKGESFYRLTSYLHLHLRRKAKDAWVVTWKDNGKDRMCDTIFHGEAAAENWASVRGPLVTEIKIHKIQL